MCTRLESVYTPKEFFWGVKASFHFDPLIQIGDMYLPPALMGSMWMMTWVAGP